MVGAVAGRCTGGAGSRPDSLDHTVCSFIHLTCVFNVFLTCLLIKRDLITKNVYLKAVSISFNLFNSFSVGIQGRF